MAPRLKWRDARNDRPEQSGYYNVWFADGNMATVHYSAKWDCFNHYDHADGIDDDDLEYDSEVFFWSEPIVPHGAA